jgi:hypothetical protein
MKSGNYAKYMETVPLNVDAISNAVIIRKVIMFNLAPF